MLDSSAFNLLLHLHVFLPEVTYRKWSVSESMPDVGVWVERGDQVVCIFLLGSVGSVKP